MSESAPNDKLRALLREQGAYEVLSDTAQFMNTELAEWHRANGRPDLADRFQKSAVELSHLAHRLLFP